MHATDHTEVRLRFVNTRWLWTTGSDRRTPLTTPRCDDGCARLTINSCGLTTSRTEGHINIWTLIFKHIYIRNENISMGGSEGGRRSACPNDGCTYTLRLVTNNKAQWASDIPIHFRHLFYSVYSTCYWRHCKEKSFFIHYLIYLQLH